MSPPGTLPTMPLAALGLLCAPMWPAHGVHAFGFLAHDSLVRKAIGLAVTKSSSIDHGTAHTAATVDITGLPTTPLSRDSGLSGTYYGSQTIMGTPELPHPHVALL